MASEIIATAEWTADGYDYVLDVEEVGGSADANDLSIISPITIRCGDPNYAPMEPVLERQVAFRLRDTAKYLRGRFAAAGASKHLLNITRDAEILFRGYLDTRFQSHLAWHENPEFEVSAFDGLALLDGFPWLVSGDKTFREILTTIYSVLDLDLPCNIVMEWRHDGDDAGTEPPDALRWRAEDWLPENSTYADALRTLCEMFNAQFFQARGAWWFVQRAERGAAMNVYPIDEAGAADTAYTLDPDYTAEDTTLLRATTEVIEHPNTALVTITQQWLSRGLRNGGFELLNPRYWNVQGGAGAGLDGGWIMDTAGDYAEQEVQHTLMAIDATRDKLVVHLDFEIEVDASASGTATVGNAFLDYLEIKLIEADGSVSYDDGATGGSNAWTGTPTYIQYPFLLAASAGTTVSETDLKWTTPAIPSSPCKIVLKFIYQANPNSDGDYINSFQINRAWVYHARPDPEDDIDRPDGFTYAQGLSVGGEHLEQEFILGDMYDRHIVPGVMQYYDGADWQFTTDWDGLGQKIHKKRLLDIVAQLGARIPGYVFGHVWGEEVDVLSSVSYDPDSDMTFNVFLPVFEERIIHPVGAHSVRTTGYELLGAEYFIPPDAEAGTLFVGTYNSNNTLMEKYSVVRVNPDGSTVTLKSFEPLLTPQITLAIDEDELWLFAVNGLDIWRMRYDGSDASLIYTLSGYDRIGDIAYMSGGTYDGYLFFTAVDTSAGVDDDVYRVYKDGTSDAKVSTNQYAGTGMGIAIRSTTELIVNASYTNAGILSYGAAGSVYGIENSTQIFNSSMGIAYDPDNDQAYLERGIATSSLSRTPSGLAGSYTDFTGFATLGRITPLWFDRAQQRLWYGGTGIKYRAIGALNTAVSVAPTTGGSGTTGNYGTTKIIAVQG